MKRVFPKGLSPVEALRAEAAPHPVAQPSNASYRANLWDIITGDDHRMPRQFHWKEFYSPLEKAVLRKLQEGDLVATALEMPLSPSAVRQPVGSELWDVLAFNFERAEAKGRGLHLINIEIHDPRQLQAWRDANSAFAAERSAAGAPPAAKPIALSDDNSVLTIGNDVLMFRGEIHQAIIRRLVDAFDRRERLRTRDVLEKSGSNADTLAKAFSRSRNWAKLDQVLRQENGFCWFEV
jgi:hypothetical protein